MKPVTIETRDGCNLSGLLFHSTVSPARACVLHSATGVPKEFYIKFADWLARERGMTTLIYDYRGFGGSRTGSLKDEKAILSDWGVKDQSAALDHLIAACPGAEINVIGHSLGGMFLNFHEQGHKVKKAFAVASGMGYWRDHPLHYKPAVTMFWWLAGPAATKIKGYMPGKALGLGADLPAGVYWQWRRWCLSRDFYRADFGRVFAPPVEGRKPQHVEYIAIADDPLITPAMVKKLADTIPGAGYRVINRRDFGGGQKIGHIAIFSEKNKAAWPLLAPQ